jgi:hypothetical protein
VIPILVAGPDPDGVPQGEDTSSEAAAEDSAGPAQVEVHGEATDISEPEPTEPVGSGAPDSHDSEPDAAVDLTADQPVDRVEPPEASAEMDGDCTVDLTMDPADLAEIRAARRDGPTHQAPA